MDEELKTIRIDDILIDEEFNSRGPVAPIDVADLANSIESQGLIQPITVAVMVPDRQAATGKLYQLIAGFRRTKATVILKRLTITAVVKNKPLTEVDARIFNLSENLQRENLNVYQEAKALEHLVALGQTETQVGERLNKSRGWVQMRFMLLKMPEQVQLEAAAGLVKQTQIRDLYTIYLHEGKERCFEAVKKLKDQRKEGRPLILLKKKVTRTSKKRRDHGEILRAILWMANNVGYGLHTRALAWAAGEITTGEFSDDVKKETLDRNKPFMEMEFVEVNV
jgi:ParB/RepB/Spo0J family partition protein